MTTKNIQDVVAEIAERVATKMDGRTVTSHEHYRSMLKKELEHELTRLVKEVEAGERDDVLKVIDNEAIKTLEGNWDENEYNYALLNLKQSLTPPTSDVIEK